MMLSSTQAPVPGTSYQLQPLQAGTSYQLHPLQGAQSFGPSSLKPGSSPSSHQSLPVISPSGAGDHVVSSEEIARDRAATYCVPGVASSTRAEHVPTTQQPSASPSGRTQAADGATLSPSKESRTTTSVEKAQLSSQPSPPPAGRGGPANMGTVGVLCKQSISFDLGVSLYSPTHQLQETPAKSRQAHSWDPSHRPHPGSAASGRQQEPVVAALSSAASSCSCPGGEQRPVSTSSGGEMAPSSPASEEKKRSRGFLHSAWLQKSKQFFKVSK